MLMVTSVRPIAISGETSAIVFDRSARFSSTSCMRRFLLIQCAPAHQPPEFLAALLLSCIRLRQMGVEHHGDAVGDFGELVEVLARNQYRGAAGREIEQGLPDNGGGARIPAPGRLAHD